MVKVTWMRLLMLGYDSSRYGSSRMIPNPVPVWLIWFVWLLCFAIWPGGDTDMLWGEWLPTRYAIKSINNHPLSLPTAMSIFLQIASVAYRSGSKNGCRLPNILARLFCIPVSKWHLHHCYSYSGFYYCKWFSIFKWFNWHILHYKNHVCGRVIYACWAQNYTGAEWCLNKILIRYISVLTYSILVAAKSAAL